MSEEYGDLEWELLFGPAIRYAEDGFVVGEELAGWLGSEYGAFPESAQAIYGQNGVPLAAGDRLVQQDLAGSLGLIADRGAGVVYGGDLGQTMVSEVQRQGGSLALDDLRANRAQWRETIGIDQSSPLPLLPPRGACSPGSGPSASSACSRPTTTASPTCTR
jgi:gamma-glutamyltranspeptidase/glutathione hydrolase